MFTITPDGGGASRPISPEEVTDLLVKDALALGVLPWKVDQYASANRALVKTWGHKVRIVHLNHSIIAWEGGGTQ